MKRIILRRDVIGIVLMLSIIGGMFITEWVQKQLTPIVYASNDAPIELLQREVLIATSIEWTEERIIKEIKDVFPENPELMVQIARCESGRDVDRDGVKEINPNAVSPTDDHGVFQIHVPIHNPDIDLYDPEQNIAFARKLYDESGLSPWNASRWCWYKV